MRITYSAPVDEAKHKSGHLSCEDYHDDAKKLNEKFREKHKILNPPKSTPLWNQYYPKGFK